MAINCDVCDDSGVDIDSNFCRKCELGEEMYLDEFDTLEGYKSGLGPIDVDEITENLEEEKIHLTGLLDKLTSDINEFLLRGIYAGIYKWRPSDDIDELPDILANARAYMYELIEETVLK